MSDIAPPAKTTHFVFLLLEDFSHLAFANAVEPLRIANLVSGQPLYRWSFVSENGTMATASNGSRTLVDHGLTDIPPCDRLFALSGINVRHHTTRPILAALRRARAEGIPLGALCSGAYVLAIAGFMDGMRVAVHWEFHDSFLEEFQDIALVRSVFVSDEPIVSASGGSATADLMLHLIGRDHGTDVATMVADQMVYNAVREGSANQRVSLQALSGMRNAKLAQAIAIMRDSIEFPLPMAEIALRVSLSTRQLERLFGKYLHTTPKKYMLELRLERARALLLQTEMSVVEIALACGFENQGHFGRVYRANFGTSPSQQRSRMT